MAERVEHIGFVDANVKTEQKKLYVVLHYEMEKVHLVDVIILSVYQN